MAKIKVSAEDGIGTVKLTVGAKGGNGDVVFSDDGLKATKYLRNTSDSESIDRFKKEIEVLTLIQKELKLDNVVNILGFDLDSEPKSYTMNKYDGDANSILKNTKGDVSLVAQLMIPVVRSLKALAEKGIFHRDLMICVEFTV